MYRVLWWFDAVIAAIFVGFFFVGLADGSVSSFNMALWVCILLGLGAILYGSRALHQAGQQKTALIILWLLAVPGILGALFFLILIIAQPRWN